MPFDAPFQLGPFSVSPDGRLALASPASLPCFQIDWRGCLVEAELRAGVDNALGELSLRAMVGRVPSTASFGGDHAAAQRDAVFDALRSLPATLPDGWTSSLRADHSVAMVNASKVAMPTTVESLLTDVTLFLLALGPYLDLLAEVGVEPVGSAAPGMLNT